MVRSKKIQWTESAEKDLQTQKSTSSKKKEICYVSGQTPFVQSKTLPKNKRPKVAGKPQRTLEIAVGSLWYAVTSIAYCDYYTCQWSVLINSEDTKKPFVFLFKDKKSLSIFLSPWNTLVYFWTHEADAVKHLKNLKRIDC